MDDSAAQTFVVPPERAGERVDRFVQSVGPKFGRKTAQELVARQLALVNGRPTHKGHLLSVGDQVTLLATSPWQEGEVSVPSLPIAFETEDFVVLDKPPGLPSAGTWNRPQNTAAGFLVARYPGISDVGFRPLEAGLVHRLDNGTSGLLWAAKNQAAFLRARELFAAGLVDKRYLALTTQSIPDTGQISSALAPDPRDKRKVCSAQQGALRTTAFSVISRGTHWALVEVTVARAYRHQIRVHLAEAGYPLLGDLLYRGEAVPALASGRHALHASQIAIRGSAADGWTVSAPLPEDLGSLLSDAGLDPARFKR